MKFRKAQLRDRREIDWAQANEWATSLPPAKFVQRNQRLFNHRFGRKIEAYALEHEKRVVSSLESVPVPYAIREKKKIFYRTLNHLASVVTPPKYRGEGYASEMLRALYRRKNSKLGILFSEVGTEFYERLGFKAIRVWEHTSSVLKEKRALDAAQLPMKIFVEEFRQRRLGQLKSNGVFTLLQHEPLWDWRVELYRTFAALKGKRWAERIFWILPAKKLPTLVAAAPHFGKGTLDCLWASDLNRDTFTLLSQLTRAWGLKKFRYWAGRKLSVGKPVRELAMVRPPLAQGNLTWLDCQLLDWW